MTHLRIRTPEGVEFTLPIAGPVSRALAYLLDFLLVVAVDALLIFLFSLLSLISRDLSEALLQIGLFALPIVYGVLSEWLWRGQTVGKRAFQLRVVDAEGLKLRPSQLILRNLLRAVDFLPVFYLVGGITTLLNRKGQRLGDLAAGTVVIRIPRLTSPDLESLLGSRFNSLRTQPHLAARLRQRIHAAEAAIALQALLRRDDLVLGPRRVRPGRPGDDDELLDALRAPRREPHHHPHERDALAQRGRLAQRDAHR
jgi:uncharacterized RDD family membrane protein YckC